MYNFFIFINQNDSISLCGLFIVTLKSCSYCTQDALGSFRDQRNQNIEG